MAKAEPLTMEALHTPQIIPKAATPARSPASVMAEEKHRAPKSQEEPKEPLQIRIPVKEARAIKVAAAERGISNSDFMLACFHAFMKNT